MAKTYTEAEFAAAVAKAKDDGKAEAKAELNKFNAVMSVDDQGMVTIQPGRSFKNKLYLTPAKVVELAPQWVEWAAWITANAGKPVATHTRKSVDGVSYVTVEGTVKLGEVAPNPKSVKGGAKGTAGSLAATVLALKAQGFSEEDIQAAMAVTAGK